MRTDPCRIRFQEDGQSQVWGWGSRPASALSIPGAVHTDLYDNLDVIPFEKLKAFFAKYLKVTEL